MNRRDFLKLIPASIGTAFVAKMPEVEDYWPIIGVVDYETRGSVRVTDSDAFYNAMKRAEKMFEAHKSRVQFISCEVSRLDENGDLIYEYIDRMPIDEFRERYGYYV